MVESVNNILPDAGGVVKRRFFYRTGADALRFWLMPFVCLAAFGLPDRWGALVSQFSRFAPLAFYILCGFFWAEGEDMGDDERPARTLRRTALRFFLLFAAYLAINLGYYLLLGAPAGEVLGGLLRKRTLFNFVVLCAWPFQMGETLWFLQSLFYVRVGLWLMEKLRLMRFYKLVMLLAFLITLLTGELAAVVKFSFLGYRYLPANWLTCALPYVLLGRLVYEKQEDMLAYTERSYIVLFVLGVAAAYGEFALLSRFNLIAYTGHSLGFGLMALSACCLFLDLQANQWDFAAVHGREFAWCIYAISQPVGLLLLFVTSLVSPGLFGIVQAFGGVCVYLVCLPLAFCIGYAVYVLRVRLGLLPRGMGDRQTLAEWLDNEDETETETKEDEA